MRESIGRELERIDRSRMELWLMGEVDGMMELDTADDAAVTSWRAKFLAYVIVIIDQWGRWRASYPIWSNSPWRTPHHHTIDNKTTHLSTIEWRD